MLQRISYPWRRTPDDATDHLPLAASQVLDLGCGVGGPAREICRFSGADIVGVNNNSHQISRAEKLSADSGPYVAAHCKYVQSDFMTLPFADGSHDHAYAIEATCHAPDPVACYKEIMRCIKPGGYFVCYEWVRCACCACSCLPSPCSSEAEHQHRYQDVC